MINWQADPREIFWILVSFLVLDPPRQLEHLPVLPIEGEARLESPLGNPLMALHLALGAYWVAWWVEGQAHLPVLERFRACQAALCTRSEANSRQAFLESGEWDQLRNLARELLAAAAVPAREVPRPLGLERFLDQSTGLGT